MSLVSFIGRGKMNTRRKPTICCKSLTNWITLCCIEYTSAWARFELITVVVIKTDCISNCRSNYPTIMTTMVRSRDKVRENVLLFEIKWRLLQHCTLWRLQVVTCWWNNIRVLFFFRAKYIFITVSLIYISR